MLRLILMALVAKLLSVSVASNKGEAEPERKETRNKVDEDRKHEYPFLLSSGMKYMASGQWQFSMMLRGFCSIDPLLSSFRIQDYFIISSEKLKCG